jgi:hypothetical protein
MNADTIEYYEDLAGSMIISFHLIYTRVVAFPTFVSTLAGTFRGTKAIFLSKWVRRT